MHIPSRSLVPLFSFLLLALASLSCALPSRSQTPPNDLSPATNTGTNPYETYGGERENINFGTGNLNVPLTLLRLPGRNGHDVVVQMAFDSRVWQLHGSFDQNSGTYIVDWEKDGGWSSIFPQFSFDSVSAPGSAACNGNYRLALPDGSRQSFPNVRNQCANSHGPYPADNVLVGDSRGVSYTRLSVPGTTLGETLVLKDGSKLLFNGVYITAAEDSNGNTISYSGVGGTGGTLTDTVGHVVTVTANAAGPTSIQYKDSNGQAQTITFNYSNFTITPTFSQPVTGGNVAVTTPFPNCSSSQPCTWSLISSIILPTGISWTFQYNAWGEMTKITYPTGGYTRYEYGVFTGSSSALPVPQDFREVTAKHSCASSTGTCAVEDTTTYQPTINSTLQNNQYMDVTDPLGNLSHYEFSEGGTKYFSPREINRKIYQGSTTLLETIHTDYNNLDTFGATQDISLPIRVTGTLNDTNQVSKIESDYDSYGSFGPTNPTIDNVIEQREYDYGSSAPGSLVRKTDNTWLKTNQINSVDYTQTAIHILNRKASQIVYNGAGTQAAKTLFEYDSYTAGITASGATQHDTAFGTGYTTRGNLTATQQWRNTDGALLTTRNQFDDVGNILSTMDPLSHTTTFSYADSWADTHCTPTGGNAAAYVTRVTNALTQAVNKTYNSCSGTLASTKDPNNLVTSFSYDLLNRRTQTNQPDGGQSTACYSEVSGSTCYSSSLPLSVLTTQAINASLTKTSKLIADGLGRTSQTQLTSGPLGTVFTDTAYDALGRVQSVSNPHASGSSPTDGKTTYVYDALGRTCVVVPPDGIPVSGGNCPATQPSNDVFTTYSGNNTTVADQAGKSRKSVRDALGRLTQVFEDPASLNYETDYTYDALDNLLTVNQKGGDANSSNWRTRTFTYL